MNRFTPICAKQHLVASFWRPDYRADRTPVEVIVISTPAGWAGANIAVRIVLASIFSAVFCGLPRCATERGRSLFARCSSFHGGGWTRAYNLTAAEARALLAIVEGRVRFCARRQRGDENGRLPPFGIRRNALN